MQRSSKFLIYVKWFTFFKGVHVMLHMNNRIATYRFNF